MRRILATTAGGAAVPGVALLVSGTYQGWDNAFRVRVSERGDSVCP